MRGKSKPVSQGDLFGTPAPVREKPSDEVVASVRKRLHATLALVKAAEKMPWTNMMDVIRQDNAVRFDKEFLPPEEAAALWAEFDVEMDRLYAIMNEGKEMDTLEDFPTP